MATAKGHLTYGLRGKLGDLVFRYRRGRTYVSKAPVFTKPPSEAQTGRRTLFAQAVAFAKAELAIPERRAYYQELARRRKGHTTAFNMAIKEFMRSHKQAVPVEAPQAAAPAEASTPPAPARKPIRLLMPFPLRRAQRRKVRLATIATHQAPLVYYADG